MSIRARALLSAPEAFGSSPDSDRLRDLAAVRALLADVHHQAVFGAFAPDVVGIVGIRGESKPKEAHRSYLWGLFVDPEYRGAGTGRRLVQAAVAFARTLPGVDRVDVGVMEGAPEALALYRDLGFAFWGLEPDAFRVNGRSLSEHHGALELRAER